MLLNKWLHNFANKVSLCWILLASGIFFGFVLFTLIFTLISPPHDLQWFHFVGTILGLLCLLPILWKL